jgi:integrase
LRQRLTDRFIQKVTPPAAGRLVYSDTVAPGLELRISADHRRSWSIRYRPRHGTRKRATYGTYPAKSLAEARARALEIAAAAADGIDLPAQEDAEREEQRKAETRPRTVGELLDHYVVRHCRVRQRRPKLVERMFESHVKPVIGDLPLIGLRRANLVELLDDLQNKKGMRAQVNRVRSQLIAALGWAIEREYLDTNPAAAIKRRRLETSRDRVLSEDELRAIWQAAEKLGDPSRALVKTWILTGQRRDEVRCMAWSELDLKSGLWTLPASRNKAKRDHEVPLAPQLVALLDILPRLGPWVFALSKDRPYSGHRRLKAILDRESGVSGWILHDLRRTCSTGLAGLHVPQDTIDRVLGHAAGSLAGTYNRHQYRQEKRRALEVWADRVALTVDEGHLRTNVVALRPRP